MIDRDRLRELRAQEESRFSDLHPRSAELAERARGPLLAGVPMPWMTRWPGAFPLFFESATGARLTDVDGLEYVDLCLGDTGAMTGHALPQVADAIAERARTRHHDDAARRPTPIWVGEELARRFGLPSWQLAMTATDANRFVLRFARHLTGRPRIAVMDWCYHGTVDETLAILDGDRVVPRPGALGPQVDVAETTAVVPFNDIDALDRRLAEGDVACLLMEPALTNIGIVLPGGGLPRLRSGRSPGATACCWSSTRRTRSAPGPAGAPRPGGLSPTSLVVGKPIGGGVPLRGVRHERRGRRPAPRADARARDRRRRRRRHPDRQRPGDRGDPGHPVDLPARGGLRGRRTRSPSGSPTALPGSSPSTACPGTCSGWAAARSTGSARPRATAPPRPPPSTRTSRGSCTCGASTAGVLLTPFHNMALFSPQHTEADVDRHTQVFSDALAALTA